MRTERAVIRMSGHHRVLVLAVGLVAGAACNRYFYSPKEDHCVNQDGDAWCLEKYPQGDKRFCSEGTCKLSPDGCVAEKPEDESCYVPCGVDVPTGDPGCGVAEGSSSTGDGSGPSTSVSTSEPTTTEPTGGPSTTASTSMSSTGTESTTTAGGCVDSTECVDPELPICFEMVCVACGDAALPDAACAEKDAGLPVCGDAGACVQCTSENAGACEGTTPVCDGPSSVCVGCTYHEQCEATACDIATGACFDDACVVEVDGDGGAEYMDIAEAIADGCVVVVHELDSGGYQENLTVDGLTVALVAADGEAPRVTGDGGPSLSVTGDANVYVQGLRFSQNTAVGIDVDGANLWLDRTEVVLNTGGGIVLQGGAYGHLRNCFVGGGADLFAVDVTGMSSSADILYTSVVAATGDATTVSCDAAAAVTVRNSALVGRGGDGYDILCDADITYSVTEAAYPGTGNVAVGDLTSGNQNTWFVDYLGGDFSLNAPPGAWLTAAQWQLGDPATDIEGEPRPNVDGTADVAGADIP